MLTEIVVAADDVVYAGSAIEKARDEFDFASKDLGKVVRWWTRRDPSDASKKPSRHWSLIASCG